LSVGILGGTACKKPVEVRTGTGPYIAAKADLGPDASPGTRAKLMMGGTPMDVEVKTTASEGVFNIELWYGGEVFETEGYQSQSDNFALVNAAGETYEPPIALLRFPMNVGDSWDWKGKMMTGPVAHDAEATVTTSSDKVDMGGSQADAVRVDLDLRMDSGTDKPALRRLEFWFVKGKGVVKREFGSSTSREPLEAAVADRQ
jgi:hypothetical protein